MGNINKVCISGNVVADCTKKKAGETPLIEFCVAVNEFRKNKDGERDDYANFIDCTLFGKRAQGLAQFVTKGTKFVIEGHLHQSRWETEDGQKRSRMRVVVDEADFTAPAQRDNAQDEIPW